MFDSCNPRDGVDELTPVVTLRGEHALPLGREPIEPAPPLARSLDPSAGNPSALLESV
jgi:hypothetical protein